LAFGYIFDWIGKYAFQLSNDENISESVVTYLSVQWFLKAFAKNKKGNWNKILRYLKICCNIDLFKYYSKLSWSTSKSLNEFTMRKLLNSQKQSNNFQLRMLAGIVQKYSSVVLNHCNSTLFDLFNEPTLYLIFSVWTVFV